MPDNLGLGRGEPGVAMASGGTGGRWRRRGTAAGGLAGCPAVLSHRLSEELQVGEI